MMSSYQMWNETMNVNLLYRCCGAEVQTLPIVMWSDIALGYSCDWQNQMRANSQRSLSIRECFEIKRHKRYSDQHLVYKFDPILLPSTIIILHLLSDLQASPPYSSRSSYSVSCLTLVLVTMKANAILLALLSAATATSRTLATVDETGTSTPASVVGVIPTCYPISCQCPDTSTVTDSRQAAKYAPPRFSFNLISSDGLYVSQQYASSGAYLDSSPGDYFTF